MEAWSKNKKLFIFATILNSHTLIPYVRVKFFFVDTYVLYE